MSFDYESAFHLGGKWAKKVAARLNHEGVECYAPEIQIAKTAAERNFMTKHEQDIVFPWCDGTIEVKSSTRNFTDLVEAYPYDSLFVDTVSGYDGKAVTPLCYAIISQEQEGIVCIAPSSYATWTKVKAYDKHRKIYETFYSAPKESLIRFSVLVDYLKNYSDNDFINRILGIDDGIPITVEEL